MGNIISKIKDTAANIDLKQMKDDLKTNIEYLDMGNLLGYTVRAAEKIDVKAMQAKVNEFRSNPVVEKVEDAAKAAVAIPVSFVAGFIGKK